MKTNKNRAAQKCNMGEVKHMRPLIPLRQSGIPPHVVENARRENIAFPQACGK
jgi:hypothetical protein